MNKLTRAAETTIRNIRSYQDHGLIDPPERRGRVGIYMQAHPGRLKLVNHLLGRGYMLSNIQELLKATIESRDLCSILGFELAIASPWPSGSPRHYSLLVLAKLFDRAMSRQALTQVISPGLLEPDGLDCLVCSPRALLAGAQMVKADFPLVEVFDIIECARPHTWAVANGLVSMVMRELDKYGSDLLPVEDVPRLIDAVWRIRPLALVTVGAELMRTLEIAANKCLDDRVTQVIKHMHEPPDSTPGPDKG